MTDLFAYAAEQPSGQDGRTFTVTEISGFLRKTVEGTFGHIAVTGEVGSLKVAASGHVYFNLKEEDAVLNAVMFKGAAARSEVDFVDGLQVVAHGRLTTYAQRSTYQLIVERVTPAGVGALMQLLEARKRKLAAEGLFDEERKKPLPFLPVRIGLVTSPTGAVIEDMLHRIGERCPRDILLWPTLVQGKDAAAQIAAAINGFNKLPIEKRPDVLIVARGGGSLEDLMPFNEEVVVRAVAASEIPIISGVGHEPDITLCDFAADLRAPTPSAAAEKVVPVRDELLYTLGALHQRQARAVCQNIDQARQQLLLYHKQLPDLGSLVTQARLRLADRAERLTFAMQGRLQRVRQQLEGVEQLYQSLAPLAPLKRGYLYATGADGALVRSATTTEEEVVLHFHDGERGAQLQK